MTLKEQALEKHYEWKGKIEVVSRTPIKNREQLSLAYTPGVAEPCLAIQRDPALYFDLTRRGSLVAVITDRDNTLAVSGAPKRELMDRGVSEDLERLMENRQLYVRQGEDAPLQVCRDVEKYHITVCAPILSGGDVLGSVLFVSDEPQTVSETETKMIQTAAGFLSRHMES